MVKKIPDRTDDPTKGLQDRMDALATRMRNIERDMNANEKSHKRDIDQIKKLLDIWTPERKEVIKAEII